MGHQFEKLKEKEMAHSFVAELETLSLRDFYFERRGALKCFSGATSWFRFAFECLTSAADKKMPFSLESNSFVTNIR